MFFIQIEKVPFYSSPDCLFVKPMKESILGDIWDTKESLEIRRTMRWRVFKTKC